MKKIKNKNQGSAEMKIAPDKNEENRKKGIEPKIITDPFGSYTGVPTDDPHERPIQDADDL